MASYDTKKTFLCACDAFPFDVGVAHKSLKGEHQNEFASFTLEKSERDYSLLVKRVLPVIYYIIWQQQKLISRNTFIKEVNMELQSVQLVSYE